MGTQLPQSEQTGADLPADAPVSAAARLITLDFIRGVAVLGILFANIVGFSQPELAYDWPGGMSQPMHGPDTAVWLTQFLLIDGKMRGLFTLLFGAGMGLFMDRAWARGQSRWLQARRLLWLGAFGLAHFFFLFWGDILFLYAIAGLALLPLVRGRTEALLRAGLLLYAAGAVYFVVGFTGTVVLEQSASARIGAPQDYRALQDNLAQRSAMAQQEHAAFAQGSYSDQLHFMAQNRAQQLLQYPFLAALETLPLMLIGLALYRLGLFTGGFDPGVLQRWGWAGVIGGGACLLPLAAWAMAKGFPPFLTRFVTNDAALMPRLAMILGLAALLAAWAPRAAQGWLGSRLVAAGRMALSNYIGTSLVMLLLFRHPFGGLFGTLGRFELLGPVLMGWALMLGWSKPWLAHYHYGPLEWLWRCLTYGRLFSFRR